MNLVEAICWIVFVITGFFTIIILGSLPVIFYETFIEGDPGITKEEAIGMIIIVFIFFMLLLYYLWGDRKWKSYFQVGVQKWVLLQKPMYFS